MFRQFFDEIDKELQQYTTVPEVLQYVTNKQYELFSLKNSIQGLINSINPATSAVQQISSYASDILEWETLKALEINKEFNIPQYSSRLIQAIRKPKTIRLYPQGTNNIRIYIDLNETAGNIDDYADAVTAFRLVLDEEKDHAPAPYNPTWASHAWEEKIYKPDREGEPVADNPDYAGKYWRTLNERISFFTTLAPFWEIIDQGTIPLSSDRGGTAYPRNVPTHFVEKAREKIRKEFELRFREEEVRIKKLQTDISNIEQALTYLTALEQNLQNTLSEQLLNYTIELVKEQLQKYKINALLLDVKNIAKQIVTDYEANIYKARYSSTLPSGNTIRIRVDNIMDKLGKFSL